MFRANRGRLIGIVLTIFVVYFLFTSTSDSDFRKRTERALARKHGVLRGDLSDEALTQQTNDKLQGIMEKQGGAVDNTETATPASPSEKASAAEDDVSVAGRKTMSKPKDSSKPKYPVGAEDDDQKSLSEGKHSKGGDPAKDIAREKLQEYLKKPIVIFSKSYCPHSKQAKHLLQDLYTIIPPPLIVELDQLTEHLPQPHSDKTKAKTKGEQEEEDEDDRPSAPPPTLGQKLQSLLEEVTGRRTVPNIMVGMHSIGGNDNIWEMHKEGTLADKIRELGGKRITSVDVKVVEAVHGSET